MVFLALLLPPPPPEDPHALTMPAASTTADAQPTEVEILPGIVPPGVE
jgi:hypothetical protein